MQQFAYFLDRLKSTPDGDGTLLDHTTLALRLRHQQQQRARPHQFADSHRRRAQRPASRVDVTCAFHWIPRSRTCIWTLLDRLGVRTDHLGDSTGELEHLSV
jgi:hypothetical protein